MNVTQRYFALVQSRSHSIAHNNYSYSINSKPQNEACFFYTHIEDVSIGGKWTLVIFINKH
jgi:hypothetical protein